MENYDITDNYKDRTHTIKVTFQWLRYKGYITYEVRGNCRGLGVMNLNFEIWDEDDLANIKDNNCKLTLDLDNEVWNMVLEDEEGIECDMNDLTDEELNGYIVKAEIIDCRLTKNRGIRWRSI